MILVHEIFTIVFLSCIVFSFCQEMAICKNGNVEKIVEISILKLTYKSFLNFKFFLQSRTTILNNSGYVLCLPGYVLCFNVKCEITTEFSSGVGSAKSNICNISSVVDVHTRMHLF
jgi:hypothetical protein